MALTNTFITLEKTTNRDRDTRTHVSITQQRNHGNNIRIDPGNTLIWLEWRMSGFNEYKPA